LALLGLLLLLLETMELAGILRSGNALPLAFTVILPIFWLAFFLLKASPSERPAVTVASLTIFIFLNRVPLGLGQLAVPLVYGGSIYLVYFGSTRGLQSFDTFRTNWKWLLLSLLVFLVIMVAIVAVPPLP
jgi:hypothetical protein